MRKVFVGILIALAVVFIFRSCYESREKRIQLQEKTALIQQQISNVAKLVVTEGHFAEVYNYEDSRELFGSLISADKRALVVVNAEASITYDLSKIEFEIDEKAKTLRIKNIPEPEIKVFPDFEYYDVSADYFNPFEAEDYNRIKDQVKASILKKVKASPMSKNAQNRLISELSKFYFLTNGMGWTLSYKNSVVGDNLTENFLID